MKITAIAYTRQGGILCAEILNALSDCGYACKGYLFHKYKNEALESFEDAHSIVGEAFAGGNPLLMICAMGIAVRMISGFVSSKLSDSPVIVMDEMGRFCIPVLSGHLGGANELARLCAKITGGEAVITTATDIRGKFAADMFAKQNQLYITDIKAAKRISADLLDGKGIYLYTDKEYACIKNEPSDKGIIITDDIKKARNGGIVISPRICDTGGSLWLIPKQITVGLGCRKGTSQVQIEAAVKQVLFENMLAFEAVKKICSIDLKGNEKGLVDFAEKNGIDFQTFGSEELSELEGSFSSSQFVCNVTGVDNVCERSAAAGSGGRLIIRKTIREHVTVAAAVCKAQLWF